MSEKSKNERIVEQRTVETNTRINFALASSSTKPIDKSLMTGQSSTSSAGNKKENGGK